ncbi:MAG: response regulator [Lentisphaerae bacterium]|nr:response regulator [Lentisphaerota bacterium]
MPRVMIVDDEKCIRMGLRGFLVEAGYTVEVAADAEEALHVLEACDCDVVVSDILLPRISGIKLLQAIHTAAPYAQVIMMTGEPTAGSAAEALRSGAFDYLSKPIGKNAILRAVGNAAKVKALDDERRRLEGENRTYQENLEQLVDARTEELRRAMEELKNAQGELIRHERLNALAQLAAGICHDFNNVLMPIRGLSDYLVTHPETLDDKAEALRLLHMIHSATDDAKEIVKRMREFYRPRDVLDTGSVDLNELCLSVVELTRPRWETQARSQGRRIEVRCDARSAPEITGNASQLREALMNLVLNAVDAMPRGGTLSLTAEATSQSVRLSISDTGDGMEDEVCKRCLEPFFSTKGEHGTGMGMAMVHGIVSRHGGTLEIESVVSKGTTIRILLPLASPPPLPALPDAPVPEGEQKPLSILVIDDEEWSRVLLDRYLKEAGHAVEWVPDGAAGVAKASGNHFDLVIMDGAMPGMNGEQAAVALKKQSPACPVLLLTGDLMSTETSVASEVDGVLAKPITQRELLEMVRRLTVGGA